LGSAASYAAGSEEASSVAPGSNLQRYIALQTDGTGEIGPRRKIYGAAARGRGCIDGLVDRLPIGGLAIGLGAERLHVVRGGRKTHGDGQNKTAN
jgi:hypothetical protein